MVSFQDNAESSLGSEKDGFQDTPIQRASPLWSDPDAGSEIGETFQVCSLLVKRGWAFLLEQP